MFNAIIVLVAVTIFVLGWLDMWMVYYYFRDYRAWRKIHLIEDWIDNVANKCKYRDEGDVVSIPASLPTCKLTNDVCIYDNCPLIKKGNKKVMK